MGQFVEQGYEFDLTADEVDRRLMLIGDFSRPNLLHNSRFQVNQRSLPISSGVTTTSIANEVANNVIMAGSFIVDRWHTVNPGVVYMLDAGHYIKALNSDGTDGGVSLKQKIWSPKFANNSNIMFDEDVTVSILYSDGNLFTGTGHTVKHADFTSANEGAIVGGYISAKDNNNNTVAYIICRKDAISKSKVACAFELHIMCRNASIIATKVEIGTGQTLAKKVGNKWILIDQYNYDEDLKNCQRFYRYEYIRTSLVPFKWSISDGNVDLSIVCDNYVGNDMIFTPTVICRDFNAGGTNKVLICDGGSIVTDLIGANPSMNLRIDNNFSATSRTELAFTLLNSTITTPAGLSNGSLLTLLINGGHHEGVASNAVIFYLSAEV